MNNKDKFICVNYGLISCIAVPATWINNIAFIKDPDHSAIALKEFAQEAYINAASSSLTNDLLFLAAAASLFMFLEGRRLQIRLYWLYIVLSAALGMSILFPLFMIARHIKLVNQSDLPETAEAA